MPAHRWGYEGEGEWGKRDGVEGGVSTQWKHRVMST